ncbi:hypothetical protein KCU83_g876, partial [Aureobasidium melanogenum]
MSLVEEKQTGDNNMEGESHENVSGTVDDAIKVEVDTTDKESSATAIEAETNKGSNSENASIDELAILRDQNKTLNQENTFLKNNRHHLIMHANAEIHRLRTILTEKDASITVAKKSIAGKQKQLDSLYATLQRQEMQITTQATQITTPQQKQAAKLKKIRLRMNVMARKNAKRFERQLAENVYEAREWADAVKLLTKQETDNERGSDEEEEEVRSEGEDEDETGGQAKGVKDGELVVIEINDNDENVGAGQSNVNEQSAVGQQSDIGEQPNMAQQSNVMEQPLIHEQFASNNQPTSNEQPTVYEQSAVTQQSDTGEQPTTAQQPPVTEQPSTTEQSDASEEHSNKRIKLSEEA